MSYSYTPPRAPASASTSDDKEATIIDMLPARFRRAKALHASPSRHSPTPSTSSTPTPPPAPLLPPPPPPPVTDSSPLPHVATMPGTIVGFEFITQDGSMPPLKRRPAIFLRRLACGRILVAPLQTKKPISGRAVSVGSRGDVDVRLEMGELRVDPSWIPISHITVASISQPSALPPHKPKPASTSISSSRPTLPYFTNPGTPQTPPPPIKALSRWLFRGQERRIGRDDVERILLTYHAALFQDHVWFSPHPKSPTARSLSYVPTGLASFSPRARTTMEAQLELIKPEVEFPLSHNLEHVFGHGATGGAAGRVAGTWSNETAPGIPTSPARTTSAPSQGRAVAYVGSITILDRGDNFTEDDMYTRQLRVGTAMVCEHGVSRARMCDTCNGFVELDESEVDEGV
ncbi:hypothetical protein M427DRAFT_50156 [Gonapodya prolifera JEL478]|uniref:Uncharacterized protein n=1 Tax=Gonapodya prolifera (strain JEL478) TaxID=1344416 RepID=A0A138ZWX3_GONPJ|nr:hypothetical protein M427DRAFT_50156 [Gonapodya prolifera JEL478]|eukprot:KXS08954.1 hypothetical protein M427DRAFT_50156 [Gonapodya prolifera JEL478]